jgi:drug/metabolite transporter (DMT)-like permease
MEAGSIRKFNATATFACLGTVVFWAAGPIFIEYLTEYLDAWMQNLLRYAVASLFWLPFLLYAGRKGEIDRKLWRRAIWPAVANIAMQCCWAGAFYYIDPAFMVLLTKSSLIWIAAFSFIFFADERALVKSKRFWLGLLLSLIGVVGVIVNKEDFGAKKTATGIALALGSGLAWAIYAVSVRAAFKNTDSRRSFAVISAYTVAGLFVLALAFGKFDQCRNLGAWQWGCLVVSAITGISLGHVLYYSAIRRIGVTIPSLVLLSQPFIVLVISHLRFGESLTGIQILCGVILVVGCGLAIWAQQHLRKNAAR